MCYLVEVHCKLKESQAPVIIYSVRFIFLSYLSLQIEKGRKTRFYAKIEERIYPTCKAEVEDELFHC